MSDPLKIQGQSASPNQAVFSFPSKSLCDFILSSKSQNIVLKLKIGDFEPEIVLSGEKRNISSLIDDSQTVGVSIKGTIRDKPGSKVTILASTHSFYANFIFDDKWYKISNFTGNSKMVQDVFTFSESEYHPSTNKFAPELDPVCTYISADFGVQFDQLFADNFQDVDEAMFWALNTVSNNAYVIWNTIDPV